MYLHLGRDTVVNTKNIISFLDLESTSVSKFSKEFLKIVEEEGFVKNVSDELPKSIVIGSLYNKYFNKGFGRPYKEARKYLKAIFLFSER